MSYKNPSTREKVFISGVSPSVTHKAAAAQALISLMTDTILGNSGQNLAAKLGHAVRCAHMNKGVPETEFVQNLGKQSTDSHGNLQYICDAKNLDKSDPYNSLDVQAWLKYLGYGGSRLIGSDYAKDQDKVMDFFGISTNYKPKGKNPNQLWCDYSAYLVGATQCRNNLPGHLAGNSISRLNLFVLMHYYDGVMGTILPFAEIVWKDQQFWKDLLVDLKKDFFNGLGKVSYDRSDLIDLAGIPSDHNARNLAEKLLKDTAAQLTDGSLTCDQDYVTFCGDVGDFAEDLKAAWDIAANLCLANGVEHMIGCICRRCWDLDKFDFSPTGLRRMPLALLTALANCEKPSSKSSDDEKAVVMLELGERYWNGTGSADRNGNAAVSWYKRAADMESGTAEASYRLGLCFQSGCDEFASNLSEAQSWMDNAARLGHAAAQVWVGEHREKEKPDEAFHWFRKASDQGYAEGHYHLGRCYENGIGTKCDEEDAISYYRVAINTGHKEARYNLALCLPPEGPGVLGKEAEALLQELVKEGHQPAMCALADEHLNLEDLIVQGNAIGDAAAQRKDAEDLLLRAAESGYTPAWIQLGAFYAPYDAQRNTYGRCAQDWEQSMECYRKAAEAGNPEGYYQLGWICCRIHGFGKMPTEEALEYFRKAAKLEHAGALYTLGIYVLEQDAQNENEEPFYYILEKAACLGHQTAGQLAEIFDSRQSYDEPPQWNLLIKDLQRKAEWCDYGDMGINYAVDRYALAHCYFQRAKMCPQTADDDIQHAMYWLEESAKSGSRVAKRELYECTRQDNPEWAMNWLRQAAAQGSCEAMRKMYLATCDSDPQEAVEWLRKAAAAGSFSCCIALSYLERGEPVRFDIDPADISADVTDEERALVAELSNQDDQDQ